MMNANKNNFKEKKCKTNHSSIFSSSLTTRGITTAHDKGSLYGYVS